MLLQQRAQVTVAPLPYMGVLLASAGLVRTKTAPRGLNSCCHRSYVAATKMATSVVVTCCVTVHDCRVFVVLVRLLRFTPSEEFFSQELLVCISYCLGCTYRYMGNRLSFLNFGSKTGLVSAVTFSLSLSAVEVPHNKV